MEQFFRVGVITTTHGIRGEVKVFPTTDDAARFHKGLELILDNGKMRRELTVESVKFFKQMVILKFRGLDSINDVEQFRQCDLFVSRENAVPLKEGEYYLADLLDMKVCEEDGNELGVIIDILETGANSVYVVKTQSGEELLLPNIPDCIRRVDVEQAVMTVHVLEGLRDL